MAENEHRDGELLQDVLPGVDAGRTDGELYALPVGPCGEREHIVDVVSQTDPMPCSDNVQCRLNEDISSQLPQSDCKDDRQCRVMEDDEITSRLLPLTDSHSTNDSTCTSGASSVGGERHEAIGSDHNRRLTAAELNIEKLPTELVAHICSYLSAHFIRDVVSKVSQCFADIVTRPLFWKLRFHTKWPAVNYPALSVIADKVNWQEGCMTIEPESDMWADHKVNFDHYRYRDGMFASVDVAHIIPKSGLLAAGSRDKYLNIIDLNKLDPTDDRSLRSCTVLSKMNAHDGWIWSMSSVGSVLATGSWDRTVKFWDIEVGGQERQRVVCRSAILCMHFETSFLVAGSFNSSVYHIDPRASSLITTKGYHSRPVLAVVADEAYVMTGSEDGTLCVYDRRAGRLYKTIMLKSFPMTMSYVDRELWLGDKAGKVQLIDTRDGRFQHVQTFDVGHSGKLTGMAATSGALITCSTDRTIRVHTATSPPHLIANLTTPGAEVTRVDYYDDILACACSDSSVGIWIPKNKRNAVSDK